MKNDDQIRDEVREHYGAIARGARPSCCGEPTASGLGCGDPLALATLRPGEVVVDLGAGGGYECLLAGKAVGPTGRVIGVDMTADMTALARSNARTQAVTTVELRLGEVAHLP